MAIEINILGKQGLIIAVLSIAELIAFLVCGLWQMICVRNFRSTSGYYEEISSSFDRDRLIKQAQTQTFTDLGCIIFCVVGIFVAALMIFGILKKHRNLIAPWIIVHGLCCIAGVGYFIHSLIAAATTKKVFRIIEVFNLGCLALYPVVMLFKQMYRDASEKKKLLRQIESEAAAGSIYPNCNQLFVETVEKEV